MDKYYLISTKYFKENSPVNENVDDNLLNNALWEAQTIHAHQILGTNLLDRLVDLCKSGDIELPAYIEYKKLLTDYVAQVIVYYALWECMPYIRFKIVNKGVESQNSDWSTSTTTTEFTYLRDDVKNKAEFYAQRLSNYLCKNSTSFEEYRSCSTCADITPTKKQYYCGLVL